MTYTVKKLAKVSGVSIRTLHFYDEIGLLKPAYYGDNNYRYYKEEQLLMLQQILFYRELGFPLNDIQRIINSDDFNKIDALISHKHVLEQGLDRTQKLIKTIDKTIAHLRGKATMKDEELYYGFDSEKQKEHEKYLVDKGILTQTFLDECNKKIKNWSDKEKNAFIQDIERIMKALIIAMENKLSPPSVEVQRLMRDHYAWLERTWTPTKESYISLIQLYQTPEFRKFYDDRHPKLLEFMVEAMQIFAESELS
jgi:DNA-binding transcriptional MerR regulator